MVHKWRDGLPREYEHCEYREVGQSSWIKTYVVAYSDGKCWLVHNDKVYKIDSLEFRQIED